MVFLGRGLVISRVQYIVIVRDYNACGTLDKSGFYRLASVWVPYTEI